MMSIWHVFCSCRFIVSHSSSNPPVACYHLHLISFWFYLIQRIPSVSPRPALFCTYIWINFQNGSLTTSEWCQPEKWVRVQKIAIWAMKKTQQTKKCVMNDPWAMKHPNLLEITRPRLSPMRCCPGEKFESRDIIRSAFGVIEPSILGPFPSFGYLLEIGVLSIVTDGTD